MHVLKGYSVAKSQELTSIKGYITYTEGVDTESEMAPVVKRETFSNLKEMISLLTESIRKEHSEEKENAVIDSVSIVSTDETGLYRTETVVANDFMMTELSA